MSIYSRYLVKTKSTVSEISLLTHTSFSIWSALHASRADTHKGTDQVLAGHTLGVTVVQTFRALVLVWRGEKIS